MIFLLPKRFSGVFPSITAQKPQFSVLSLHYCPTLTTIHDYWKNYSFDYMNLCQQSSWLQSPSGVILKPKKVCHCFHFSLSICHEVMGFSVVNEAQADIFPELPRFLHDPTNVGNLIPGSSTSSKPSLYMGILGSNTAEA